MSAAKLRHEDYTVGWICPLEVEQIAALEMLDKEHTVLPQPATDHNKYNLGSIGGHNVVIAGLPVIGNNSAVAVVTQMRTTFRELKFGLLVGRYWRRRTNNDRQWADPTGSCCSEQTGW
jgi:hypothetical protein